MFKQKYVRFQSVDKSVDFIIVFPLTINHDELARGICNAHRRSNRSNMNKWIEPVSAGFINSNFECYGRSETLDLNSMEGDTTLAKTQFNQGE